jgi:hypothetical protein
VGRPQQKYEDSIGRDCSFLLTIRGWRILAEDRDILRRIDEVGRA